MRIVVVRSAAPDPNIDAPRNDLGRQNERRLQCQPCQVTHWAHQREERL
jgi:hypothetical protein